MSVLRFFGVLFHILFIIWQLVQNFFVWLSVHFLLFVKELFALAYIENICGQTDNITSAPLPSRFMRNRFSPHSNTGKQRSVFFRLRKHGFRVNMNTNKAKALNDRSNISTRDREERDSWERSSGEEMRSAVVSLREETGVFPNVSRVKGFEWNKEWNRAMRLFPIIRKEAFYFGRFEYGKNFSY